MIAQIFASLLVATQLTQKDVDDAVFTRVTRYEHFDDQRAAVAALQKSGATKEMLLQSYLAVMNKTLNARRYSTASQQFLSAVSLYMNLTEGSEETRELLKFALLTTNRVAASGIVTSYGFHGLLDEKFFDWCVDELSRKERFVDIRGDIWWCFGVMLDKKNTHDELKAKILDYARQHAFDNRRAAIGSDVILRKHDKIYAKSVQRRKVIEFILESNEEAPLRGALELHYRNMLKELSE